MKKFGTTLLIASILAIGCISAHGEEPTRLTKPLLEQTLAEVDRALSDLDAEKVLGYFADDIVVTITHADRPHIPTRSYSKDECTEIMARHFPMVQNSMLRRLSTTYDISQDGQTATVTAQYEEMERLKGAFHENTNTISKVFAFRLVEGAPKIAKLDAEKALEKDAGSLLPLHGKTLMVYPVLMGKEGIPDSEKMHKFGIQIAKPVAMLIEEYGMRPDISTEGPDTVAAEDSLAMMESKFVEFLKEKPTETDYSLFARFHAGPSKHGPTIKRICIILVNADGQVVWSGEQTETPEEFSPMHGLMTVVGAVHFISDLKEPDWENRKQGSFARRMQEKAGLPAPEEYEAMEERFETARGSFKNSSLTIYPFRIWEQEEGSTAGAEALAKKLNEAGIFKSAIVAETDTRLVAKRDPDNPGQPDIIAASARDFRKYLKEHPPATDHALLVDVTVPVHHVHFVLCDKSGEWLHFNITNSHHKDYRELEPKTVEDCAELAFGRIKGSIKE